mmetsp:Transcript_6659/g.15821  ORF Transcript_6659/g.15821 Transcript_6659/m.15821 type:complete len:409 (+) Transcript_6659:338-1564(+)
MALGARSTASWQKRLFLFQVVVIVRLPVVRFACGLCLRLTVLCQETALALGLQHAANEFPHLVNEADANKGDEGLEQAAPRQRQGLKALVHWRPVNGHKAERHLTQEHDVQQKVGEAIGGAEEAKDTLHLRRCADRSRDLAQHERPIVDRAAPGVCRDVFRTIVGKGLGQVPDAGGGPEEHEPTETHLDLPDEAVTVDQHLPIHELLVFRVPRWPLHEPGLCGLQGVGNRCPDVCANIDEQHLLDRQCLWQTHKFAECGSNLWHLRAERVHDRFLQVLAREPALLDAVNDRGKVVVLQHDVRGVFGNLSAADAHGHPHLRLLQRRGIINAIASHCADVADALVAVLLVRLHDDLLVNGRDAGKDARAARGLRPPLHIAPRLVVVEVVALGDARLQLNPRDDAKVLTII